MSAITRQVSGRHAVLSSTSSDSHNWNLIFLQLVLEEHGYHVVNLGACVPDELLISECRANAPDLIVLSTVNGHGHYDGARVVRGLREVAELRDTTIVIGGKLGIDEDNSQRGAELRTAGFDAVFDDSAAELTAFCSYISALPSGVTV